MSIVNSVQDQGEHKTKSSSLDSWTKRKRMMSRKTDPERTWNRIVCFSWLVGQVENCFRGTCDKWFFQHFCCDLVCWMVRWQSFAMTAIHNDSSRYFWSPKAMISEGFNVVNLSPIHINRRRRHTAPSDTRFGTREANSTSASSVQMNVSPIWAFIRQEPWHEGHISKCQTTAPSEARHCPHSLVAHPSASLCHWSSARKPFPPVESWKFGVWLYGSVNPSPCPFSWSMSTDSYRQTIHDKFHKIGMSVHTSGPFLTIVHIVWDRAFLHTVWMHRLGFWTSVPAWELMLLFSLCTKWFILWKGFWNCALVLYASAWVDEQTTLLKRRFCP